MENEKILFILSGGTLDSISRHQKTRQVRPPKSKVESFLKKMRAYGDFDFFGAFMKDSRDINDEDRMAIAGKISDSRQKKIIITHGTYTMAETGAYLDGRVGKGKTVVLVGAFVPLSEPDSDAKFNLGYAISEVRHLPPGVYICMNGKTFSPSNCRKNNSKRIFEEK
jgi:L-asparaginase